MAKLFTKTFYCLIGAVGLSTAYVFQKIVFEGNAPILLWEYAGPTFLGGMAGFFTHKMFEKIQRNQERDKNLNLILRTLRNLNQLLVTEKDRTKLLQGICNNLVENRRYFNAWIVVMDKSGRLSASAEAGLGKRFAQVIHNMDTGDLTECAQKALADEKVIVTENPAENCPNCPLSPAYSDRAGMTVRLEHHDTVYGLLCVSVPNAIVKDKEEHELFKEIGRDVALALYKMELEGQRDQAEKAMEASERLFRSLAKVAPVGIFRTDIDGECTYVNQRWADISGLETEMALGQGWVNALHPEDRNRVFEEWHTSVQQGLPFSTEYRFRRPDGQDCWVIGQAMAEVDNHGNVLGYVGTVTDITARKQAENDLRKSEENFRDLVESSLVGIQLIQSGKIIYQNPEQKRLFGPLPRSFNISNFDNIYPDDLEKVRDLYMSISSGEIVSLDVDFRFYPMGKKGSEADMKWVYCRASMFEYQNLKTILVSMIDISRAKELEQLLRVQDKMSSLGRVAAGIAHEIRNPLSGINIYLNTLEKIYDRFEQVDKVQEILTQLQAASNKIESVIKRVMDFSKPSQPQFVSANINGPISEAFKLSAVSLRKRGIAVEKSLAADLPICRFDPHMIEQVVLNLLNNASEAMKYDTADKKIGIKSSCINGQVIVQVYDSGPGIQPEARDKIFDPFYTTKSDGTGIGLSLCHRIVTDHGGTMRIDNSQWGGAEFTIELPAET